MARKQVGQRLGRLGDFALYYSWPWPANYAPLDGLQIRLWGKQKPGGAWLFSKERKGGYHQVTAVYEGGHRDDNSSHSTGRSGQKDQAAAEAAQQLLHVQRGMR